MNLYRTAWQVSALLVACVGIALLAFSSSLGDLLASTITITVVMVGVTAFGFGWRNREASDFPVAEFVSALPAAAIAGVGSCGLLAAFGPAALIVLLAFGLTSPPVVRAWLARRRRAAEQLPPEYVDATVAQPVGLVRVPSRSALLTMTEADLCQVWRRTFVVLGRVRSAAELAHVAELRRVVLDALAERDPAGFARWMDDGARAASDPGRYLRPGPDRRGRPDNAASG